MIQRLADRLGISTTALYVVLGVVVLGVAIWLMRRSPQQTANGATAQGGATADSTGITPTGNGMGSGGITNAPWSSGADFISANPLPWSPEGGADGGTGLGTGFVPPPQALPLGSGLTGTMGSGSSAPGRSLIHTGPGGISYGKTY